MGGIVDNGKHGRTCGWMMEVWVEWSGVENTCAVSLTEKPRLEVQQNMDVNDVPQDFRVCKDATEGLL